MRDQTSFVRLSEVFLKQLKKTKTTKTVSTRFRSLYDFRVALATTGVRTTTGHQKIVDFPTIVFRLQRDLSSLKLN